MRRVSLLVCAAACVTFVLGGPGCIADQSGSATTCSLHRVELRKGIDDGEGQQLSDVPAETRNTDALDAKPRRPKPAQSTDKVVLAFDELRLGEVAIFLQEHFGKPVYMSSRLFDNQMTLLSDEVITRDEAALRVIEKLRADGVEVTETYDAFLLEPPPSERPQQVVPDDRIHPPFEFDGSVIQLRQTAPFLERATGKPVLAEFFLWPFPLRLWTDEPIPSSQATAFLLSEFESHGLIVIERENAIFISGK